MAETATVLLIEDNEPFRTTLELLFGLRADVEVVGSLADGAKAVEACRALAPDVLVLDYRLPGLDGAAVARAVRASCPEVAIVCLTGAASEEEIAELERVGVAETVTKDEDLDTIVAAVRAAAGMVE